MLYLWCQILHRRSIQCRTRSGLRYVSAAVLERQREVAERGVGVGVGGVVSGWDPPVWRGGGAWQDDGRGILVTEGVRLVLLGLLQVLLGVLVALSAEEEEVDAEDEE